MLTKENRIIAFVILAMAVAFATVSCVDSLNTTPIDDSVVTSVDVYDTPDDFRQVLAKLYAGYAATGQQGPAGMPDIQGIDEGFSSYIRQLWVHQTLPTDEAVVAWNDPGLPEFNFQAWGPANDFVMGMYSRIFYQITLTNEFIRETQQRNEDVIRGYEAEARFLRALSYWHSLDMFGGNVPFVTEQDPIGAYMPNPTNSTDLFEYIESELLDIVDALPAPAQNDYGRADRGAAWTLLAKLYLNAEVYTGQNRYSDALDYAQRVIDDGAYSLTDNYEHLFLADNDRPAVTSEIIFPVRFDGDNLQTFGGTNFIIHAAIGGNMSASEFGMDGGWAGHRVTPELVTIFDVDEDGRAMFHTDGQTLEVEDYRDFNNGYAVTKWKNVTHTGEPGKRLEYADTDFPMFRLADVYLIYAEAAIRGGGGDMSRAVSLVNELRERAYGSDAASVSQGDLNLDFILDERGRELYWEGHRRTDLRRFDRFTGDNYVWAWKGNQQQGAGTDSRYEIFPIPSSDINSNLNLTQNPGY